MQPNETTNPDIPTGVYLEVVNRSRWLCIQVGYCVKFAYFRLEDRSGSHHKAELDLTLDPIMRGILWFIGRNHLHICVIMCQTSGRVCGYAHRRSERDRRVKSFLFFSYYPKILENTRHQLMLPNRD